MEPIEQRLRAYTLRQPPDTLRARVLDGFEAAPSEWKRLLHTLEGCAAALLLLYSGCAWFEQGTEALRRQCRTLSTEEHKTVVVRQVAEATDGLDMPEIQRYFIAQQLESYHRPYRGRPES